MCGIASLQIQQQRYRYWCALIVNWIRCRWSQKIVVIPNRIGNTISKWVQLTTVNSTTVNTTDNLLPTAGPASLETVVSLIQRFQL
jgi:hypothetical protein